MSADLFGDAPEPSREKPKTARDLRDEAIDTVIRNERKRWLGAYMAFAMDWIRAQRQPFIGEAVRVAWEQAGNHAPHHPNVYGGVWSSLVHLGVVVSAGEDGAMKTPKSHARKSQKWWPAGRQ